MKNLRTSIAIFLYVGYNKIKAQVPHVNKVLGFCCGVNSDPDKINELNKFEAWSPTPVISANTDV